MAKKFEDMSVGEVIVVTLVVLFGIGLMLVIMAWGFQLGWNGFSHQALGLPEIDIWQSFSAVLLLLVSGWALRGGKK